MDNNKKKLICIIDVQNDFIDGALRNEEAIKAIPKMEEYLNENLSNAFIICNVIQYTSGWHALYFN